MAVEKGKPLVYWEYTCTTLCAICCYEILNCLFLCTQSVDTLSHKVMFRCKKEYFETSNLLCCPSVKSFPLIPMYALILKKKNNIINIFITTGVDHGGMRGMACTIIPPPYKGDEQMKWILHNTQIITPEEIVSYIDDEIIFSRKFE